MSEADIVIVDDDDVFGDLLQQRLEAAGFRVVFQHGPFGTINLLKRLRPRLVISDVNMPAIPGDALCRLVRESPGLEETKILFMSSMHPRDLRGVSRKSGADDWLSKSATMDEVIAAVRRLTAVAQ